MVFITRRCFRNKTEMGSVNAQAIRVPNKQMNRKAKAGGGRGGGATIHTKFCLQMLCVEIPRSKVMRA